MSNIQDIKNRIDCCEYASRYLNLPIHKSGDRTISLEGGSNPTALCVNTDFWYDFKMCQGGDVIDLCAIAKHGGNRGPAIAELGKLTGVESRNENWEKYTQNLNNLIQLWHEQLREEDREYLHNRRIDDETINRLKIGLKKE